MNGLRGEIITFGPSLARPMKPFEVMAHLEHLDGTKALGVVHIAIMPSYQPNVLNVEAWLEDGTRPVDAAKALQVAYQRLRTIHKLGPAPQITVIDPKNSNALHVAQQLVDMCRQAKVRSPSLHSFDRSREECVRMVAVAIASGEGAPR